MPLHFGQTFDGRFQGRAQGLHVGPGPLQDGGDTAVLLVEERKQQMLRLDVGVVVAHRHALRIGKGLLEFGGQFVETHRDPFRRV